MNISARTEYACIAVLELALRHGAGEPVRIRSIAESHGIPPRFLVQILLQLKGAGLVASTRGAAGGYRLAKAPEEIALADVMQVIDGPLTASSGSAQDTPVSRALRASWEETAQAQREALQAVTFADLAERASASSKNMYYI